MASKLIVDREKSATAVANAGETHADTIGAAFAARYRAFLRQGEQMPDMALSTRLAMRALRAARADMVTADDVHEAELADDEKPRTDRDTTTGDVRERLITYRGAIAGGYGAEAERDAGFVGEIPRDPVPLVRYGRAVVARLKKIKLPPPLVEGIAIHPVALADKLVPMLDQLNRHIEDVARELREAEGTLSAKNLKINAYDDEFAVGAQLVETGLRIAGETALAARVKPSTRRPGTTASSDDGGADAGGGEAGGEGATGGDK